mmetsp:Transcript_47959/g.110295  ORF Transcript_47959/g.110295 Transcript_47959/m.110295 type:complete len:203 (+) Transcript_47959:2015-2623(+)
MAAARHADRHAQDDTAGLRRGRRGPAAPQGAPVRALRPVGRRVRWGGGIRGRLLSVVPHLQHARRAAARGVRARVLRRAERGTRPLRLHRFRPGLQRRAGSQGRQADLLHPDLVRGRAAEYPALGGHRRPSPRARHQARREWDTGVRLLGHVEAAPRRDGAGPLVTWASLQHITDLELETYRQPEPPYIHIKWRQLFFFFRL